MTHDKEKHNKEKDKLNQTPQEIEGSPLEGNEIGAEGLNESETPTEGKVDENVTIPLQEYARQMEEIDQLKNKVNEYSDGWQRERADFTNYRNILQRDQELMKNNLTVDVVKKYLVVSDDIDRALKNAPDGDEVKGWLEGIRLIYQKLQTILESEGVQRIPAENENFDPHRHEAIATEENPLFESGHVIEIIQQGYQIGDRVIRPARVKVAK